MCVLRGLFASSTFITFEKPSQYMKNAELNTRIAIGGRMSNSAQKNTSGELNRRDFLQGMAAIGVLGSGAIAAAKSDPPIPIIDAHIHLFDASRPQGAPYKGPKEFTGHISLPAAYRKLATPLGIKGAIAVEASSWVEDNLWLLETAQTDTIMVGVIGRLQPEKPEFAEYLERYHKNPLYRGIRINISARNHLMPQLDISPVVNNLKLLAQSDLVLETANPSIELLQTVVRVNDLVPELRIVIDHLPVMDPTPEEAPVYRSTLEQIRQRPNLFVKLSEILHRVDGNVAKDLASHRERLDYLMQVFGEDRIIFGSDYPNSVGTATIGEVVSLVKQYFATQPRSVAEKYFWKNSLRCYKWTKRASQQPSIT
jgi:L-fuconolactonase